jgi:Predicted solute binding protein
LTGTITLNPVADAYVSSSSPTTNFGTSKTLYVDNSPIEHSYIQFNVQGLSQAPSSVTLKIFANSTQSTGFDVSSVADNTWTETGINYSNAPAFAGTKTGSSGAITTSGTFYSVDVTSLVTGNGQVSFGLLTSSSTAINMSSRESGANAPQLVITVPGGATPTPTNTPVNTPTPTDTPASTPTPTNTPTVTNTPARSPTPTNTPVNTPTPTNTPVNSPTPTDTPANTPTPTNTPTVTNTPANSPTPTNTPASTPTPTATLTGTIALNPVADAYVVSASPTSNFGTSKTLYVDNSPIDHSYVQFNVQGLSQAPSKVTLKIFANSTQSTGYDVYSVADNTWTETGINYSNAPAFAGTKTGSSGAIKTSGQFYSVDVTSLVTGNGQVSFGLLTTSSTAINLSSRESGANAPQLVITP